MKNENYIRSIEMNTEPPIGFKRVFQLMQLLHAQVIAEAPVLKQYPAMFHRAENARRQIGFVIKDLESNLPEDIMEGMLDEQNDTYKLLMCVLDMHPDQRTEVITALRGAGIMK